VVDIVGLSYVTKTGSAASTPCYKGAVCDRSYLYLATESNPERIHKAALTDMISAGYFSSDGGVTIKGIALYDQRLYGIRDTGSYTSAIDAYNIFSGVRYANKSMNSEAPTPGARIIELGDYVYALTKTYLFKLKKADLIQVSSLSIGSTNDMVAVGNYLYVVRSTYTNHLLKIDPTALSIVSTHTILANEYFRWIASDGINLYCGPGAGGSRIYKVRVTDMAVIATSGTLPINQTIYDTQVAAGFLILLNSYSGNSGLHRVDLATLAYSSLSFGTDVGKGVAVEGGTCIPHYA
jgi:hypothetical protein